MSTIVSELYDALLKAGVEEPLAKEAARAVMPATVKTDLATRGDLAELKAEFTILKETTSADLAELKADVIKWNVGAMAVLTAIFAAIVRLG